jgi:disulfide oxidoreductase YuzD
MSKPIRVEIIGAKIACKDGVKDTWREIAEWAGGQLRQRFGDSVAVQYFDLFDSACPSIPSGAQLPIVLVEHEMLSSGGKISVPKVKRKIEMLLNIDML